MAVATTTIAAGAALASSAIGAGMSFSQAAKQSRLQREAMADAEKAIQEAKGRLDVNVYEGLDINKEAYEFERNAALVSGAQAMDAAVESERGASAAAGRITMANNQNQGRVRSAMVNDLNAIERTIAGEDQRLLDEGQRIAEMEAVGSQEAATRAEYNRNAALASGAQALGSMVTQLGDQLPLYMKTGEAYEIEGLNSDFAGAGIGADEQANMIANLNIDGIDTSAFASMNPTQRQNFLMSLSRPQIQRIREGVKMVSPAVENPGLAMPNPSLSDPYAIYNL